MTSAGSIHPFDEALQLTAVVGEGQEAPADGPRLWQGQTHPGYLNMVGPFGGLTAAQVLHAVLQHPGLLGEPVALTVNFAAALVDGPFRVEAVPVRTNRSTQHWIVALTQADASGEQGVVVTATVLTALRRDTWSGSDVAMPSVPPPGDVPMATREGKPTWLGRYDVRYAAGELTRENLVGEERDSLSQVWVRDDPPRPIDFCSLTARADVFFPRVWRRRGQLTPAGTVSLTVYFHAGAVELAASGTGYLLGQAQGKHYFNGFFDQSAELWNEAGALLATSHQVVYFKG